MWKTAKSPQFPFFLSQRLFRLLIWVGLCDSKPFYVRLSAYNRQGEDKGKTMFSQKHKRISSHSEYEEKETWSQEILFWVLTVMKKSDYNSIWKKMMLFLKWRSQPKSLCLLLCATLKSGVFWGLPHSKITLQKFMKLPPCNCAFKTQVMQIITNISAFSLCDSICPRFSVHYFN